MDDVQEDIASLGVRNWKIMASDRVQWRTVVRETKVHFGLQSWEEEEVLVGRPEGRDLYRGCEEGGL